MVRYGFSMLMQHLLIIEINFFNRDLRFRQTTCCNFVERKPLSCGAPKNCLSDNDLKPSYLKSLKM